MDRRYLAGCVGIVALLALASSAAYRATAAHSREATRRPRPLAGDASARDLQSRRATEPAVVHVGLIEPAIPPSPKNKKPAPPQPAAAPAAPQAAKQTAPVAAAADKAPADRETRVEIRDSKQARKKSNTGSAPSTRLITRPKSALTTPGITPAVPPTVPIVVKAPQAAPQKDGDTQVEDAKVEDAKVALDPLPQKPETPAEEPRPKLSVPVEVATKPQLPEPPSERRDTGESIAKKSEVQQPAQVPDPTQVTVPSQLPEPSQVREPSVAARKPKRVASKSTSRSQSEVKSRVVQREPGKRPAPAPVEVAPAPKVAVQAPPAPAVEEQPAATPPTEEVAPKPETVAQQKAPAAAEVAPNTEPAPETVAQDKAPAAAAPQEPKLAAEQPPESPAVKETEKAPARLSDTVAENDAAEKSLVKVEVPGSRPAEETVAPQAPAPSLAPDSEVAVEPERTELPWARPRRQSPELAAALKQADDRVLHGYDLASRGAVYAARAEFIAALNIIAQAHDAEEGTRRHTRSAVAGLTALREAADFARYGHSLREVDIAQVVVPHTTPILKESDTLDLTPSAAAACYYNYAQEQLSAAVAQEVCGSMALYAMGKVAVMSGKTGGPTHETSDQAMALYRASLIAFPKNYRAANELGVLLAEGGQYELARDLLIRSVSVAPQIVTWRNLAAVHARSGETALAERAKQEALALEKRGQKATVTPNVQWVDPATFASTTSASDALPVAVTPAKAPPAAGAMAKTQPVPAAPTNPQKLPDDVAKKSIGDWIRLGSRRQETR